MNEKTLVILDPVLKKGFTSVPNIVLFANNLSMQAKCLYSILLSFAWSERECFPGQERLAEVAGCTDRTIRKYLDELKEYGLIYWVQRGLNQTNIYYICDLSKVERLKALGDKDRKELSGPDRKGCSVQDRKELSDKEYSDQYNVVVDPQPEAENISNSEDASSTVNDGAAFDLPTATGTQGIDSQGKEMEADREEKPEETPAWEHIRSKVRAISGADISIGFAKEIAERYPLEKVSLALEELRRQLAQGVEIRGVGAWLRYALENHIQPDQPAKAKVIPEKRDGNNRTPRARPKMTEQEQREKKREFLKSLYA